MSDQANHLRGLVRTFESRRPGRMQDYPPDQPVETTTHPLAAPFNLTAVPILPPSAAIGAVSYGPICSTGRGPGAAPVHHRMMRTVQNEPRHEAPESAQAPRLARAIAIASGKGGVGKSNLAVNLAVAMSQLGLKVCLLDADLGLANADVLCNLFPKQTLEQVVTGRCRLADAMLLAPGGFRLIPGASGVTRMADLGQSHRRSILDQLSALERVADVLLIDCGAGIGANVLGFASAAQTVVIPTTPEPTALTDAYGIIKSLFTQSPTVKVHVVVNMAMDQAEGAGIYGRINRVSRTFLNQKLEFGGTIVTDSAVPAAVRQRVPFVLFAPDCPATLSVRRLARSLTGINRAIPEDDGQFPRRPGFFERLATWMGIIEGVEYSP